MGGPIRLLPTAYILEFAESLFTDVIKVLFISRFNVLFLENHFVQKVWYHLYWISVLSTCAVAFVLFDSSNFHFNLSHSLSFDLYYLPISWQLFFHVCLAILSLSLSHTYTCNIYFHVFDIKFEILAVLKCFLSANWIFSPRLFSFLVLA